jgi:hypothetical protein
MRSIGAGTCTSRPEEGLAPRIFASDFNSIILLEGRYASHHTRRSMAFKRPSTGVISVRQWPSKSCRQIVVAQRSVASLGGTLKRCLAMTPTLTVITNGIIGASDLALSLPKWVLTALRLSRCPVWMEDTAIDLRRDTALRDRPPWGDAS